MYTVYGVILKVYWKAYLALLWPPDEEKKHNSTLHMKIIVFWAVAQNWNFDLSAGKLGKTNKIGFSTM